MQTIIEIPSMSIIEAKEYERLFFTFQQKMVLSEEQAAMAVSIAVGVCPACHENAKPCYCLNDEEMPDAEHYIFWY